MKIVLFGPERRIGAWQNDKVIDLNRALANYLRDQRGETNAEAHADEKIPPRLERFIALGKAAIEDAERAIEHATKQGAEAAVHDIKNVKLHAPGPSGGSLVWAATTPRTSRACGPVVLASPAIWRRLPRWPKKKANGAFGKLLMRLRDRMTRFPIRNGPGASITRVKLPS